MTQFYRVTLTDWVLANYAFIFIHRHDEYFSVFNLAWYKGMTPNNCAAGFKRTGLWPVDINKLPKKMFNISKGCKLTHFNLNNIIYIDVQ